MRMEGCVQRKEGSKRKKTKEKEGRLAELCLRNDAGHKSSVISESGSRRGGRLT